MLKTAITYNENLSCMCKFYIYNFICHDARRQKQPKTSHMYASKHVVNIEKSTKSNKLADISSFHGTFMSLPPQPPLSSFLFHIVVPQSTSSSRVIHAQPYLMVFLLLLPCHQQKSPPYICSP